MLRMVKNSAPGPNGEIFAPCRGLRVKNPVGDGGDKTQRMRQPADIINDIQNPKYAITVIPTPPQGAFFTFCVTMKNNSAELW